MEIYFQLIIAYDMFHYIKFTALSIKTICRALFLLVLKILASVGVTPRTKQLGVTPRTPLFEGKNPENQKTKISIKKGRLLLVNDQGFSQIRPT